MKKLSGQPNQYLIALATAVLSALVSVGAAYFTFKLQSEQLVATRNIEMKAGAYLSFLERAGNGSIKAVSQIQNAGRLLEKSISDSELQEVEDAISGLPANLDTTFLVDLNAEFNLLRTAGSQDVRKTVDDIYYVLAHRHQALEMAGYPLKVQKVFIWMHPNLSDIRREQVSAEGWELRNFLQKISKSDKNYIDAKVGDEERFSIALAASMFDYLLDLIREELDSGSSNA